MDHRNRRTDRYRRANGDRLRRHHLRRAGAERVEEISRTADFIAGLVEFAGAAADDFGAEIGERVGVDFFGVVALGCGGARALEAGPADGGRACGERDACGGEEEKLLQRWARHGERRGLDKLGPARWGLG